MGFDCTERMALGLDPAYPCSFPVSPEVAWELVMISPEYWSGQTTKVGRMVVHRAIASQMLKGFARLYEARFPIAMMVPIVAFHWDDLLSMRANNTSAFNSRLIAGANPPRPSLHAYGLAFDLNPLWNPCRSNGIWLPDGARFDSRQPGALTVWVVQMWEDMGFTWGGRWNNPIDIHHFQMPPENIRARGF